MSDLHILNGDFALKLWEKCNFQGESLVWRETYLEGPLPENGDLQLFRKARAGFLSQFAEISEIGAERLYLHLQKMESRVLELPPDSTVMLWFDACIFDQTILMRILYLLHLKKEHPVKVFLYCCDSCCLTAEDFHRGSSAKVLLLPADLETGAKAWMAFLRKDQKALLRLAEEEDFSSFPAMKKALLRCADEVPDRKGLTRTQRQILQIVSEKSSTFEEIFKALDKFEEYPFLGDTACQRHLDFLVEKGLLELTSEKRYQLP